MTGGRPGHTQRKQRHPSHHRQSHRRSRSSSPPVVVTAPAVRESGAVQGDCVCWGCSGESVAAPQAVPAIGNGRGGLEAAFIRETLVTSGGQFEELVRKELDDALGDGGGAIASRVAALVDDELRRRGVREASADQDAKEEEEEEAGAEDVALVAGDGKDGAAQPRPGDLSPTVTHQAAAPQFGQGAVLRTAASFHEAGDVEEFVAEMRKSYYFRITMMWLFNESRYDWEFNYPHGLGCLVIMFLQLCAMVTVVQVQANAFLRAAAPGSRGGARPVPRRLVGWRGP